MKGDEGGAKGEGFFVAARSFRDALRKHDFTEPAARLVDVVIRYSLERGRFKALIPRQGFFCLLCGLRKSKVSEELDWLERAGVLEVGLVDAGRSRGWCEYGLLSPAGWRVPLRVKDGAQLRELESWLEVVEVDGQGLLAGLEPPESLNDLLRETSVERLESQGAGRVESSRDRGESSPRGNCGAGSGVLPGGTLPASSIDRSGSINRVDEGYRSIEAIQAGRANPKEQKPSLPGVSRDGCASLEKRLFALIGEHERHGRSGLLWQQCLAEKADRLSELVALVEDDKRSGARRIRNAGAWLNASARALF